METILKQVQSKERLKSEETEKIRTTESKSKRKDAEEKGLENNLDKIASHNENSNPDILQEPAYSEPRTEPTDLSNSKENRENDNEKEEISTQQNQATFPEKDVTPSFNRKRPSHDKKSVVILGDSMTKLLNGWDMAKKIQTNCKVFIKTFSGATVSCMEDYMKPSLRNPPDHFILHVGTNDLSSDKSPHEIAESIINLACQLKNEKHDVSVSKIILRTNDKILNEKGIEVNSCLKELCKKKKNIFLVDNSKKIKAQHWNKGKLHLTKFGSKVLSNNFVNEIYKVFH